MRDFIKNKLHNTLMVNQQVVSNLEVSTIKETVSFEIVSQVELR